MDHFHYHNRTLFCEDVAVAALAEEYGTPLWVYSRATLLHHLRALQQAFAAVQPLICYSIKTNPNLHIVRLMVEHGAGLDVTSGGELYRARFPALLPGSATCFDGASDEEMYRAVEAGCYGERIVFAGVGKTDAELRYGLDSGVLLFNVESEAELHRLGEVARAADKVARVALRVNPDLPPKTHVKTDTSVKGAKFGLDIENVLEVAQAVVSHPHLRVSGLHMHLGSPILDTKPYRDGVEKAKGLIDRLRKQGHPVEYLNMGGGFGIHYRKQEALPAEAFAAVMVPAVQAAGCKLILEPGRFIAGNAGILVSRVIYTKDSGGKHIVIQDAAMNDLIRPTLYESFHRIWPVQPPDGVPAPPDDYEAAIPGTVKSDVVGPVCESGDFLAKERYLPAVDRGDLLATFSAGAYGMSMSSNYNGRPRAAEVLVDGNSHRLIRRRETFEDLVRPELEVTGR
jgi:diaminopimelate decarboxylase